MKKEMSKMDIQAKMDVLKELHDMCKAKLGDKVKAGLDGMKSVTVSAPDSESLEEGLEMAQELTPEVSEMDEEKEMPDQEDTEMETSDEDDGSADSMFNQIRKKKGY